MKSLTRLATFVALALLACRPLLAADAMTESLRSLQGEDFDQRFLQRMIDHHRHGIEMAKLAAHHSRNQAITKFAGEMIEMQQQDIAKMTKLLGSQGSSPAGMEHGQMDQMQKMSMTQLEAAQGTGFDQAFVKEMTKHHSDGLEMAQLAQERAARGEVREIAAKIVQEQKSGIKKLKGLSR